MARAVNPLQLYRDKRDFRQTSEPYGAEGANEGNLYVVQKHDARRLHYDFRIELDGVLKSWAVTKGPSLDPAEKRLAVRTEDHPLEYAGFEGVIPKGYGAGTMLLWDRGTWEPKGDPREGLDKGALQFTLRGERLEGGFTLVRMKNRKKEKRENWLLIKERDGSANRDVTATEEWTQSVSSGRELQEIAEEGGRSRVASRLRKPAFIAPQLAKLEDRAPEGEDWLHEIKFDGYRIQALIRGGKVRLFSRNEKDWTTRYGPVAEALSRLHADSAIIDGEVVAVDEDGRSNFSMLQRIRRERGPALRYYAFDLLHLDGEDLRSRPLSDRKELLRSLVQHAPPPLRYSDHIAGEGDRVVTKACDMGMEGIISKRADAPYRSGRGGDWIKTKCISNDEFVIVGYRKSSERGRPFASLLLGEYDGDGLVYRGRVGTGFNRRNFEDLKSRMKPFERRSSPLVEVPREARKDTVWLAPQLVAQIAYTEQTTDGRLRHPSFAGLREDKPAEKVTAGKRSRANGVMEIGGVRLTHPDKVMYPDQGATKREIAAYLFDHANYILPFLKDRVLSLVRCPDGRQESCFFQRHHNASIPEHLNKIDVAGKKGKKAPYLVVRSAQGLVATAQIGALELHIWGARTDRLERPERVVFDLDPDASIAFGVVRDSAFELRDVLQSMVLDAFPLLTGGKGIHVIVPVERRRNWEEVKAFSRGLARKLAAAAPDRYVAGASKAKREGKIFIDWLRNERGATAVVPYSLRAKPGAPVATPVSWAELRRIDSAARYTLGNIGARLANLKSDPWNGYSGVRQSITQGHLRSVSDS